MARFHSAALWRALPFGLVLAGLWAFHAAAYGAPGRAYFHVTRLNDLSRPLGPNLLLHPAFLCAALFVLLRYTVRGNVVATKGSKCGVTVALACWSLGATLSTLLNLTTDQVLLTYGVTFLAGTVIYAALSGTAIAPAEFEIGAFGLLIGAAVPVVGGLAGFIQEWGVPDVDTALAAYKDLVRMQLYEAATFGSRGNTATFVVIIAPMLLWIVLDSSRRRLLRLASAAMLVPIFANLAILQIRAAFLTFVFSLAVVFGFKLGARRYPLFLAATALALGMAGQYSPDVALMLTDRLRPVVTVDTGDDVSVMERAESIKEGLNTAERHWVLGIGPGGAITKHSQQSAHQFEVQQFMETGVIGLVASAAFTIAVLIMLLRTLMRGQDGATNNLRFALVIGPASFVFYGIFSNPTFTIGYVNTWTILVVSMLALAPPFERRSPRVARPFAV